jgi:hypothetical protein
MVNSWNKFCFTGGIVEIDAILPGEVRFWELGILERSFSVNTTATKF